ncbi:MAG: hypothetical protein JXB17_01000 [Bacteroidales bacterium]|nr:hypothetical protein [Bacteroidales bacterium]
MKLRKSGIFLLLIINSLYISCFSQKPEFHGTLDNIADNREYFSQYAIPQTILGARVDLNAEFFNEDSVNSAVLGFNYMYECGHNVFAYKPVLDIYYHYHKNNVDYYMGSFPRKNLLFYPLILLTDSLQYYRPNIEGGLGQITGKLGYINVWIDWTSRQTNEVRETFLAGISGKFKPGLVYIEEYLYMYHRAGVHNPPPGDHIRDNGGGATFIGVDLSEKQVLNKLLIDIGLAYSYDRYRPNPYGYARGGMMRFETLYKRFGINGLYYSGDKQHLAYGDMFYSGGKYGRLDIIIIPFSSNRISSRAVLGIHFAADEINTSQQVLITYKFL